MADTDYVEKIQKWRRDYAQKLAAPDGWLAAAGLFWLEPGDNFFGTSPDNKIVLPAGSAPDYAGVFHFSENGIRLQAVEGVIITVNDQPVSTIHVQLDENGSSEWIILNDLKLSVIQRGMRYGVRIFDKNNPSIKQSVYLRWFPIQEKYVIQARFIPSPEPKCISIVNVIGDHVEMPSPGTVEFSLQREKNHLLAIELEDGRLWFMFKDLTNGDLTYPGGRYLTADAPVDGVVTLDFNRAYNPPCAFTDFATCPLPPRSNYFDVPIRAGALKFH